jgi:hypothetical protein
MLADDGIRLLAARKANSKSPHETWVEYLISISRKRIEADSLQEILETYGKEILSCLAEKQIVLDGKELKGVSPTSRCNSSLYIL